MKSYIRYCPCILMDYKKNPSSIDCDLLRGNKLVVDGKELRQMKIPYTLTVEGLN